MEFRCRRRSHVRSTSAETFITAEPLLITSYRLDRDAPNSTLYAEVGAYDNSTLYHWDETFDADVLAAQIDVENQMLFEELKRLICSRLSIPYTPIGCESFRYVLH